MNTVNVLTHEKATSDEPDAPYNKPVTRQYHNSRSRIAKPFTPKPHLTSAESLIHHAAQRIGLSLATHASDHNNETPLYDHVQQAITNGPIPDIDQLTGDRNVDEPYKHPLADSYLTVTDICSRFVDNISIRCGFDPTPYCLALADSLYMFTEENTGRLYVDVGWLTEPLDGIQVDYSDILGIPLRMNKLKEIRNELMKNGPWLGVCSYSTEEYRNVVTTALRKADYNRGNVQDKYFSEVYRLLNMASQYIEHPFDLLEQLASKIHKRDLSISHMTVRSVSRHLHITGETAEFVMQVYKTFPYGPFHNIFNCEES